MVKYLCCHEGTLTKDFHIAFVEASSESEAKEKFILYYYNKIGIRFFSSSVNVKKVENVEEIK